MPTIFPSPKKQCWDLAKACANRGFSLKFAVSPVADRLLEHHRGFGGVSYVYLNDPKEADQAMRVILGLEGVEEVLDRAAAAARFFSLFLKSVFSASKLSF